MDFLKPCQRRQAYEADITYGTNNEFGFDYLKDNMVMTSGQMVQRELNYAIVDEVDSILIDEARTPLIISAPAEDSTEMYYQFARLVRTLHENSDYNVDEKMRAVTLTEEGIARIEKALGVANIYESQGLRAVHHLEQALKAEVLFKLDRDYVVKNGEVIIVDEFTGRLMPGRRYSEGLHQAIEAKENVKFNGKALLWQRLLSELFSNVCQVGGHDRYGATEAEEFAKIIIRRDRNSD
jgi:preprotein translocase subunit SecA